MGKRADEKTETRQRIITAASKMIRREGIAGLKVADVMAAAGLTHGAFYAHFADKNALVEAAFHEAADHREGWLQAAGDQPPQERLAFLLHTYLTPEHKEAPEDGCAFAALAREFAQEGRSLPKAFEAELNISLTRISELLEGGEGSPDQRQAQEQAQEKAMGLLSLCVGGLVLARAVDNEELSENLLKAATAFGVSRT